MPRSALNLAPAITLENIKDSVSQTKTLENMVPHYFNRSALHIERVQDRIATLCCIDSRWHPGLVLGQGLGASYGMRNIANLANPNDPEMGANLEYLVSHKKVPEIMIMGHTDCGGAEAHMMGQASQHVQVWVNNVIPAKGSGAERTRILTDLKSSCPDDYEAIRRQHEKLCLDHSAHQIEQLPFVAEAIEAGHLSIGKMIGNMHAGQLEILCDSLSSLRSSKELIGRFAHFKAEEWKPDLAANGQNPDALIITGISPYLSPEKLFGIQPGDAFIYRNLGGRYNYTGSSDGLTAAIEFAVAKGVKEIIHVGSVGDVNQSFADGDLDAFSLVTEFLDKGGLGIKGAGLAQRDVQQRVSSGVVNSVKAHPAIQAAGDSISVSSIVKEHETGALLYLDPDHDDFRTISAPSVAI